MSHTLVSSLAILAALPAVSWAAELTAKDVVLAIHGGTAGDRKELSPEEEKLIRADMQRALEAGQVQLKRKGGKSLDAVEAAIRVLEDSPHFNAGRGAVFTHEGRNELDASIMDGNRKTAGAVASVTVIKNPISAARAVMEQSKHVLLVGRGAEVFAGKHGIECVDPAYFWTEKRWKQIEKVWKREAEEKAKAENSSAQASPGNATDDPAVARPPEMWSTVGAVALDPLGDLAAGTSTGGISNKMYGRVGDSPIIGAGTYAENDVCAVSGTGQGEYFIRLVVAHEIAVLMKYKNLPLEQAASEVIGQLTKAGGEGGVITLDAKGNFAAPYNTPGLYRGYLTRDGKIKILLYAD